MQGWLVSMGDVVGGVMLFKYDVQCCFVVVVQLNGDCVVMEYDDKYWLMVCIELDGQVKCYWYGEWGEFLWVVEGEQEICFDYDVQFWFISMCLFMGVKQGICFDVFGCLFEEVDVYGNVMCYDYVVGVDNLCGNWVLIILLDCSMYCIVYNVEGLVVVNIDLLGWIMCYIYGLFDLLISIIDVVGYVICFEYDYVMWLVWIVNVCGEVWEYCYDVVGWFVIEIDWGG